MTIMHNDFVLPKTKSYKNLNQHLQGRLELDIFVTF